MTRTNSKQLSHGVGVWEAQHELAVVLVSTVADHVVLGSTVDVAQALLQDVGGEHGRPAAKAERLGNDV